MTDDRTDAAKGDIPIFSVEKITTGDAWKSLDTFAVDLPVMTLNFTKNPLKIGGYALTIAYKKFDTLDASLLPENYTEAANDAETGDAYKAFIQNNGYRPLTLTAARLKDAIAFAVNRDRIQSHILPKQAEIINKIIAAIPTGKINVAVDAAARFHANKNVSEALQDAATQFMERQATKTAPREEENGEKETGWAGRLRNALRLVKPAERREPFDGEEWYKRIAEGRRERGFRGEGEGRG